MVFILLKPQRIKYKIASAKRTFFIDPKVSLQCYNW